MKFSSSSLLTLAVAASVQASHHAHGHAHHHRALDKRAEANVVMAYVLNGKEMTQEEVCDGIMHGRLGWTNGENHDDLCNFPYGMMKASPPACPAPSEQPPMPSSPAPPPQSPNTENEPEEPKPEEPKPEEPKPEKPKPEEPKKPQTPNIKKPDGPQHPQTPSGGEGVHREFPDGTIACGDFPSQYGAIRVDYLGLGGYIGIQHATLQGEVYGTIRTAIAGETCSDGSLCSYACPPGYQKSQWPPQQGSTGESLGGLACRGGKLYLTNRDLSSKLCIPGTGGVHVKSNLDVSVSICRTDYPGTESETVPLDLTPNGHYPLTCPKAESYYFWQGKPTSAQYYVNPAGVGPSKACQWGNAGTDMGNWAPLNIGVGEKAGVKWLSMFPNRPTTNSILKMTIEIVGESVSGSCKYKNGKYYTDVGVNEDGCTVSSPSPTTLLLPSVANSLQVSVVSGDATFVFSYD